MTRLSPSVVVLHAVGDRAGGQPWRDAFAGIGWAASITAPDLPGHRGTPPPVGGAHELSDPAFAFAMLDIDTPVDLVIGIGTSGWAAQLVALGGRARSVVVVDGLGAPWRNSPSRFEHARTRLRALEPIGAIDTPEIGLDAAILHPPQPHGDLDLARRVLNAMSIPVLLVETPAGAGTIEVGPLMGVATRHIDSVRLDDQSAPSVAREIARWWTAIVRSR